jgi:hypothetical protein
MFIIKKKQIYCGEYHIAAIVAFITIFGLILGMFS